MKILLLYLPIAYLLGALPVGYWLTHFFTGKNILEEGSGNIGSTNVKRTAGKKIAALTQLLDMAKGLLPVGLYLLFYGNTDFSIYAIALASIIGHDFSLFLRFKGGKGVNTTLGASLLLAPAAVLISVLTYFLVKWRFRYVSLSSIILSITLSISELIIHGLGYTFYYFLIAMLLIIFRHKDNIRRMINHEENKAE